MITVLSGGTGTPKLLQGLVRLVDPEDITVVVNTVENGYFSGVYVAPDVDTVIYTLAGIINEDTWYGVKDDTFITHETLSELGCPELLRIGDRDRAFKIQKTLLLEDHPLHRAVDVQCRALGVRSRVLPMSNQDSDITIVTDEGEMGFHTFLIERGSEPRVLDVRFSEVEPAPGVIDAVESADLVIIGPSNPVTSIGPIIGTSGVRKALKNSPVYAVSPFAGDKPFSGPAGKFMRAWGYSASSLGVAEIYRDFLDRLIIDEVDAHLKGEIEKLIKDVEITKTIMKNIGDKIMLARILLGEIL
ncbi:2-phospho-L-lactate transferase [Methanothermobacter wolfeii]|uniref:2-phospho-L-lactate transferase n=1 Tax=Methanothermobacter wolfeii TaxID=145261 RepID=A0A9E7RS65_METWO|nr:MULTISPECIES: 2-phospho-L-lactate transferase [Methanothermobacter]MDI6701995.1 2-phospho-L-lactate transferase [Methanothermobacter wolfeii]MDI6842495.1 2-phospho-L-lactate transferase [Methanothermobacter wolfeii]NLM02770.1 2-phospho-L-lactate transferase [Methanothermobacter wolfeii]QHN06758.1 2-phospho-L-lactate transferase [Methanothermobacter sp. THM-1]UXH31301.1 2-phospho-L-lactate transferase [Methanothermobacter wolfeii]